MVSRRGVKAYPVRVNYVNLMIFFGLFANRKCDMADTGSEKIPLFQRV
jgi:hypothetical protein